MLKEGEANPERERESTRRVTCYLFTRRLTRLRHVFSFLKKKQYTFLMLLRGCKSESEVGIGMRKTASFAVHDL